MTERVLGPTGSRRRRRFMVGPLLLMAVLALMFTSGAQAVHLISVFELDANAIEDGSAAADDWASVFNLANGSSADNPCVTLGALDCSYTHDPTGTSIFTTGGSKDDLNIPSWRHTAGSVPDKDEIEDAMAAMYDVSGDQILYFAADRLAVNGSADFGFWFFKSDVSTNADGTFSGVHTVGDLLLLGTFTNGGADTTIRAFVWDPANATINGTLRDPGVTLADCSDTSEPDNGCGAVNDGNTPSPWTYQSKSSKVPANTLPSGAFFEGGINLSAFNLEGCFSSFLAETRSSPSIDATLKDFVLGDFESCGATMTTDASSNSFEIGGSVSDSATISVTGINPPAPTGNVLFYLCGPAAGQSSCSASGTLIATVPLPGTVNGNNYTVSSGSQTPTTAGDYCFFATWAGDTNYPDGASVTNFSDECFTVTPKQPAINTVATGQSPGLPLGNSLDDTANLSGTANKPNGNPAGGTITFTAYGPHSDTTTCTTVAYTSVVSVNGDGAYVASTGVLPGTNTPAGAFTPTAPGTYNWIAVYSGDSPNTKNVSGACGDANEGSVIISLQPTIATSQWVYPNDDATITVVTGGGDLTGSVKFSLYNNSACTGSVLYEETRTIPAAAGLTETLSTTNGDGVGAGDAADEKVSVTGTYSWLVVYTSTNPAHKNVTSQCHDEHFQVTFTNDDPAIPAP